MMGDTTRQLVACLADDGGQLSHASVLDLCDKKWGLAQLGIGNDLGYFHSQDRYYISCPKGNGSH